MAVAAGATGAAGTGAAGSARGGVKSGPTATVSLPSVAVEGVRLSLSEDRSRFAAAAVSATRAPVIDACCWAASSTAGRAGVTVNSRTLAVPSRAET